MTMNTSIKPKDITRKWYIIDAKDAVLGRAASKIAEVITGKHKAYYAPQWDMGDHVIVVNAEKIMVTGRKETQKTYYRHSGYPGGLRAETVAAVRKSHPEALIERAVKGMLPKNRLQKKTMEKLYIYTGDEHPHEAQKPEKLTI